MSDSVPQAGTSTYNDTNSVDPSSVPSALEEGEPSSLRFVERLLHRLASAVGNPPVVIGLWNQYEWRPPGIEPVGRILIDDRWTLAKLLADPLFEFGEAFRRGCVKVEGDLVQLLCVLYRTLYAHGTHQLQRTRICQWLRKRSGSSARAARSNIHHHYDIGNDFYSLWLDQQLLYTCAYFPDPAMTLEEAQDAKMEHVCRKLRLRPGEVVFEAGCGWGAFALHMARHHGVRVRAFNISHEQILYARQRARQEGLHDRVEYVEDDWRNIQGQCDVFASIGMLEHVGLENYQRLGDIIDQCLTPMGRGLIHSIGQNFPCPLNSWIERRIFPGAQPPSLGQMAVIFEPHDFSILDVENLRLHYAMTLRHWLDRFERRSDRIMRMFDEQFVRTWRLYLAGSSAAFETGGLQLFQLLFARGNNNDVPWTRSYMYADSGANNPFHAIADDTTAERIA